ncbi:glycoside hydrolase family 2 TIM barrel-domain containing protein [Paraglaciecola sp.]|uniref:glycoside hydrolase family 2 TIM barrel-domain containing protein n=1 Tax=Paraglaciecola sp. TaxID=1920173 RepID=UPI003EF4F560
MKYRYSSKLVSILIVLLGLSAPTYGDSVSIDNPLTKRQEIDFNFGWKFTLGKNKDAYKENYDDSNWRHIRLPHDWSIEADYAEHNRAGATAYLPGGLGWYRKSFINPNPIGKTQILFDGIYNHSKVWINGHLLGERPYGYVGFHYDLTPYLHSDNKPNHLAIFVDRSRYVDSRWYTGSGIYRNVTLVTTNKVNIPIWGSFVTTPVINEKEAQISINTRINNDSQSDTQLLVLSELLNSAGNTIHTVQTPILVNQNQNTQIEQSIKVSSPTLWSPDSPTLYTIKTSLKLNGRTLDTTKITTGLRYFENHPVNGFSLNGKPTKIKGVNIHHDGGLVGSAVPKGVWKRRLQTLKQAGVNAIRTAHNPASTEFLDLCDELGFLVQEEAFDEWDNPKDKRKNFNQSGEVDYITQSYSHYFAQWAEQDIKAMLYRDRNHPSIFQWSIGNEIEWTYPRYTNATGYWDKQYKGAHNYYWDEPPFTQQQILQRFMVSPIKGAELVKTAENLSKWTKQIDDTRPVTANLVTPTISHETGFTEVLDVVGYSYRQAVYELGHKHYPDKMILGTENWVQWHEWKAILDNPFIAGIFVWTGIDYLGEANGRWPKKGSGSGMLDFAGFTKPSYHMMKTVWDDTPHLYLATQTLKQSAYKKLGSNLVESNADAWKQKKWGWHALNQHWNYQQGESIAVEVYTNQTRVELFLNDKSLGIKHLENHPDRILKWLVPFDAGKLTIKSLDTPIQQSLHTAGKPVGIRLSTDKKNLLADAYDVAHITAQLIDKDGHPVKHLNNNIQFIIDEKLTNLGVDNGAADNIQKHKTNNITTHNGKALLIVQSTIDMGKATVKASIEGSKQETLHIVIQ